MSNVEEFASASSEIAKRALANPQTPRPVGYQLLLMPVKLNEKTSGGIIIPETSRSVEDIAGICFYVVDMGSEAYQRQVEKGYEPYCDVGDFVVIHAYTGTRVDVSGEEYRLVNDDSIKAVVEDPRGVRRAQ